METEKDLLRQEILTISAKSQAPSNDENLFDSGFLDSLDFMRLIQYIEENFGVSFEMTDLRLKNFTTINTMAGLIEQRRKSK